MKKDKGAAVGLVICFVAMIAIVGAITFRNYKGEPEEVSLHRKKKNYADDLYGKQCWNKRMDDRILMRCQEKGALQWARIAQPFKVNTRLKVVRRY